MQNHLKHGGPRGDASGPEFSSDDSEFFAISLDHLCVAGFDGYWKRLNPAWSRTLGWSDEELMSRPLIEFCHPDDRAGVLGARERLKIGEPLRTLTNRYVCKDGSYRWFEWRSIARVEKELVYCIARDVTAEKDAQREMAALRENEERLRRQLILADRLASVGTLAAGVAHEINNPLAYVMTNAQALVEDARADSSAGARERETLAEETLRGAERIRAIVRGLMTFSRADEERRAVVDIKPVLELSIKMAFNEIRHRARLVREDGPTPPVLADESRLGQVFINLLVNAAQAVCEGGGDANEIRVVTFTDASGHAVVEVRDSGPGIPESELGRIFDPFYTTKPVGTGTGLGLSICHGLVAAIGGQISAANRAEGGAVFRVTLPCANQAPAALKPLPASAAEPDAAPKRGRVLIVDDERAVAVALGRVLRAHDVTIVSTANEALDLVVEDGAFDVIVSDLMMPGMSGIDLYEALAERSAAAAERIVFVTGGAFTPAAKSFLDRVSNARFEKPFEPAAVRALVAERVALRRS